MTHIKTEKCSNQNNDTMLRRLSPMLGFIILMEKRALKNVNNGTVRIKHQCMKIKVLSCHRCLIKTGDEKINYI
jgi:hypothetical protein